MEIVSINKDKQKSEHDQTWKGKVVHLDIITYDNGFHAIYYIDCVAEPVPGLNIPHRHKLAEHFTTKRWWHRFVGIRDEQLLARVVDGLKREWEMTKQKTTKMDGLLSKYGVGESE